MDSKYAIRPRLRVVESAPFQQLPRLLERAQQAMLIGLHLVSQPIAGQRGTFRAVAQGEADHVVACQVFVVGDDYVSSERRIRDEAAPLTRRRVEFQVMHLIIEEAGRSQID